MDATSCTIDNLSLPVVTPGSVGELGEIIRRASQNQQAIYPLGGRTQLHRGIAPNKPGLGVDLRKLNTVIDYPARDMTITVQAGITLAELQQRLATENQRLPIDIPHPQLATLGGAMAVNLSGPRRLGAGTFRDYVIGITVVNDNGQEAKAGGRVVKNVAGYDLCKLHIGALGTLGIITQVTLKVIPRPESQAILTFGCEPGGLSDLFHHLHQSRTRPMCIELFDARARTALLEREPAADLPEHPFVCAVGFEDNEPAVTWQMQQLMKELNACGVQGVEVIAGSAAEPLWHALREFTDQPQAKISFKVNTLAERVAELCNAIKQQSPAVMLQAHAGNGILHGHCLESTLDEAKKLLDGVAQIVRTGPGDVIVTRCPTEWKPHLAIWGKPRNDLAVMRAVKKQFDPEGRFNPGRFVDGI